MFVPDAFPIALLMMVASMICWGSWANTYKLTKGYRFELFYWDYAIGIFLISLVLALTLGSMGSTPEAFFLNVRLADPSNVMYAMVGGVIFNVANLLLVAGIEFVGMAVAFPVAIGIALVVGVVLSYAVQQTGDPWLLGLGVFLAEGRSEGDALERASLYAAISTTRVGTQTSFLDRAAFEKERERRQGDSEASAEAES